MATVVYSSSTRLNFIDIILCHFVYGLTKISVVLFCKRIFTIGGTQTATNVLLVIISIFVIVSFLVSIHSWYCVFLLIPTLLINGPHAIDGISV
jgi:hypothetical protein